MSTTALSEILPTITINNNVNVIKNNNNKTLTTVRLIVDRMQQKLPNPQAEQFYYKVAWKLPEAYIFTSLEQAMTGHDPQKYFSFLCNLELRRIGV